MQTKDGLCMIYEGHYRPAYVCQIYLFDLNEEIGFSNGGLRSLFLRTVLYEAN